MELAAQVLTDAGWQAVNSFLLIVLGLLGGRGLKRKADQERVDAAHEKTEELASELRSHRERVAESHERIFSSLDELGGELHEIYQKIMDDPRSPGELH